MARSSLTLSLRAAVVAITVPVVAAAATACGDTAATVVTDWPLWSIVCSVEGKALKPELASVRSACHKNHNSDRISGRVGFSCV